MEQFLQDLPKFEREEKRATLLGELLPLWVQEVPPFRLRLEKGPAPLQAEAEQLQAVVVRLRVSGAERVYFALE